MLEGILTSNCCGGQEKFVIIDQEKVVNIEIKILIELNLAIGKISKVIITIPFCETI